MFSRSLLLLILIFAVPTFAANKKKPGDKKAAASQAAKTFDFIPFDRLATLHHRQLVHYVHALREIAVQAERSQIAFHSAETTAMLEHDQYGVYAGLFFPEANADDDTCNGRGANPSDQCIDAFFLSTYPNVGNGKEQAGQCKVVETCKNGTGVLCNFTITGIPANNERACVPYDHNYKATQECFSRMKTLQSDNLDASNKASAAATAFFNLDNCQTPTNCGAKKFTGDMANTSDAANALHDLVQHAYDDDAMATLIKVISLYKNNHLDFPKVGQNTASGSDSAEQKSFATLLSRFPGEFDAAQDSINLMYKDYLDHCNQPLCANTITSINNFRPGVDNSFHGREGKRKTYLQQVQASGGTPTNGNVLEKEECINLTEKTETEQTVIIDVVNTCPNCNVIKPPINPPAPPVQPTVATREDNPTGCGRPVYRNDAELYQGTARCAVCPAEAAAERYAQGHPQDAAKYQNYTVSNKWMSFMAAMASACGCELPNGRDTDMETMSKFLETFGDCGEIGYDGKPGYEWPDSGIGGIEASFIQKVNTQNFWNNEDNFEGKDEKRKLKNLDNEFKQTFGIRYKDAAELFCPETIQERWFHYVPKVKAEKYCKLDASTFKQNNRKNFTVAHIDRISMDPKLKQCMKESIQNADKFYPDGMQCFITAAPHTYNSPILYTAPDKSLDLGGTSIIASTGMCEVARFTSEKRDATSGRVARRHVYSLVSDTAGQYDVTQPDNEDEKVAFAEDRTGQHFLAQKPTLQLGPSGPIDSSTDYNSTVTYENPACWGGAAGDLNAAGVHKHYNQGPSDTSK